MSKRAQGAGPKRQVVATNRRARYDYSILDTYEAGIALTGTEVKSLREGKASLADSFATVDDGPECVVSGGKGTMAVSFQGKTYYVCCTGCRDEFKANPEKYVKEYEAKKKAKK